MDALRLAAGAALAATLATPSALATLTAHAAAAALAPPALPVLVLLPVHSSYQLGGSQLCGGHHWLYLASSPRLLCLPLDPRRLHLGGPRLARVDAGVSSGSKVTATNTAGRRQISIWHN